MLSRRMQYIEDAFKKSTSLAEQFRNCKEETDKTIQDVYERIHSVYGVASVDLVDEEDKLLAKEGEKVFLLYPMTTVDGSVFMTMKTVDPVTATMRMTKVCVYDPSPPDGVKRRVSSFSVLP